MSSLTAAEATGLLGVKPATLYAYVSRGLVRSEPGPAGTRERRYNAQDVHALLGRQTARRDPEGAVHEAVGGALHWGVPVLDSALTLIAAGKLRYRGQDAVTLARQASVEEVAALLWTGDPGGWAHLPLRARMPLQPVPHASSGSEALAYALAHAGAHDLTAGDTRPAALPAQAARVLNLLYATLERFGRIPPAPDLALHARLARVWNVPEGADLLRLALILLADHELNVSTFTARVTASGGANLHHVTLAALCALQGRQHGLSVVEASELVTHAHRDGPARALRDAARRQARLPGFGHRLYPDGDPRAAALLAALEENFAGHPALSAAQGLAALVRAETGERPNVDLALGTLGQVLGRETDDAVTLFALGRAVGWLAHALEAMLGGQMIRPRARYVGRME
ncbi:citrate synthase [Deinococcus budaensis]|uniref:citrate synthase (unknown stereospecificity) n=1 Tax=Deinococcus budaensis TaxID=1665626 RepID=A0A7W8LQJ6_9DEIO|nr:citrate synthase [Deinococcus budaensis]MBB5234652.1 citrate synthase [Deinococcus budaensis]